MTLSLAKGPYFNIYNFVCHPGVKALCTGLIISLSIPSFSAYGQSETSTFITNKYGGTFSYGSGNKNSSGTVVIFPETDSTVLFYIELNKGAPSYNSGTLYGRLRVINGKGTYESRNKGCKWELEFLENKLSISTLDERNDCEFGNGVVVDGVFRKTSLAIPDYFVNLEGIKYFFKTTSPEKYYKD